MPNPAYPKLPINNEESKRVYRDGREEDVLGDGATRVRKLHADKADFDIVHSGLNATQAATLNAFYASYSLEPAIDFYWPTDGVTYVVKFGKGGVQAEWIGPGFATYRVRLVG